MSAKEISTAPLDLSGGLGHPGCPQNDEECEIAEISVYEDYMTTDEACSYLKRSRSFLLTQPDIPYLRGHPNTYAKRDLDEWFDRHKQTWGVA